MACPELASFPTTEARRATEISRRILYAPCDLRVLRASVACVAKILMGTPAAGARVRLPLLAAALLLTMPLAQGAPEQVHVGLRGATPADGLAVSWVETDPRASATLTLHAPDGDVKVEGRIVPGPTPGVAYEARLPALQPGVLYTYEVGGRAFNLTPPPGNASVRFAALGDMGTTREAGDAVATLQAEGPDLVLHAGDVSYAGGEPRVWKAWFDLVEPVASSTPWLVALGNHEGDVLGVATDEASVVDPAEQAFIKQRFPVPGDQFWYSFDAGPVHFIALDTFSQLQMPAEEAAWLKDDLAKAAGARWKVAFLHEPPYSSNAAHGSAPRAYGAFAGALEEAGVDLVVAAHDHSYERSHVLHGGKVVAQGNVTAKGAGTVYLVTGGGGAALYETFVDPQPEWSALRVAKHHVLLVNATMDALDVRAVATDGSGDLDAFRIQAASPAEPTPTTTPVPAPSLALVLAVVALAAIFGSRRK